jgi:hypothetical protein
MPTNLTPNAGYSWDKTYPYSLIPPYLPNASSPTAYWSTNLSQADADDVNEYLAPDSDRELSPVGGDRLVVPVIILQVSFSRSCFQPPSHAPAHSVHLADTTSAFFLDAATSLFDVHTHE